MKEELLSFYLRGQRECLDTLIEVSKERKRSLRVEDFINFRDVIIEKEKENEQT